MAGQTGTDRERTFEEVVHLTHAELRAVAAKIAGTSSRRGLCRTELVDEVLLRFLDAGCDFENTRHFLCAAAKAMRRLLVEDARQLATGKRGGDFRLESLREETASAAEGQDGPELILDIHRALDDLPQHFVNVVELHYFAGYSHEEIAEILGISSAKVNRDMKSARATLLRYLQTGKPA